MGASISPDLVCSAVPVNYANKMTSYDDKQEAGKITYQTCIQYYGQFPAENQNTSIIFDLEPVVKEKIRIPFSFMLDDIRTAAAGNAAATVPASPEGDPSAAVYAKIIDSELKERYPDIADKLQPVNLSREDQGIRLDVHYIAVDDEAQYIVYSLLDLEADSRDGEIEPSFDLINYQSTEGHKIHAQRSHLICSNEYNGQRTYVNTIYVRNAASSPAESFPAAIVLDYMPVSRSENVDFLLQVKEYAAAVDGIESPELLSESTSVDENNVWSPYTDSKATVLDYTRPLDIPLYKTLSLTGAGWIDGKLHVQLHNKDAQLLAGTDLHRVTPSKNVYCYGMPANSNNTCLVWDDNGDNYPEWHEYIFDVSPEDLAQATSFYQWVTEYTDILRGDWTIELPRIQAAEEPASAAQESAEASGPDSSTPEGRYAAIRV